MKSSVGPLVIVVLILKPDVVSVESLSAASEQHFLLLHIKSFKTVNQREAFIVKHII